MLEVSNPTLTLLLPMKDVLGYLVPLNNTTLDAYAFIYDRQIYESQPCTMFSKHNKGTWKYEFSRRHPTMIMSVNNTDDNTHSNEAYESFR